MDPKEKILDVVAQTDAALVELHEDYGEEFARRFKILLTEAGERAPKIWAEGECPIELTIDAWGRVPRQKQNQQWRAMGENLIASAQRQAWVEIMSIPYLQLSAKWSARKKAAMAGISRADIRSMAKAGVGKARFDTELQARRDKRANAAQVNG